jgi:hypothetical protein
MAFELASTNLVAEQSIIMLVMLEQLALPIPAAANDRLNRLLVIPGRREAGGSVAQRPRRREIVRAGALTALTGARNAVASIVIV